jgi:hypothetical protein
MNEQTTSNEKLTSDLVSKIREDAARAKANGGCNRIISILNSPYMGSRICGLDGLCSVCKSRSAR